MWERVRKRDRARAREREGRGEIAREQARVRGGERDNVCER